MRCSPTRSPLFAFMYRFIDWMQRTPAVFALIHQRRGSCWQQQRLGKILLKAALRRYDVAIKISIRVIVNLWWGLSLPLSFSKDCWAVVAPCPNFIILPSWLQTPCRLALEIWSFLYLLFFMHVVGMISYFVGAHWHRA